MPCRLITLTLIAGLMAGCAHHTPPAEPDLSDIDCNAVAQPETRINLEMVDALSSKSRYHAALAQLESAPFNSTDHWTRYGQLLAATGQLSDAEAVFRAMAATCKDGVSSHGLGMVLLKQHAVSAALPHLEKARQLSPASGQIRNDYGYALLLVGRYPEARFELRTALELANGQGPVRQNLAVVYLLTDDRAGLTALQSEYGFSADELQYAQALQQQFAKESP